MSKKEKISQFNPSDVAIQNGHFIGLPFREEEASIVLFPVPWDLTVSSTAGTATGAQNILECSNQLDLCDPYVADAWKLGIFMRPINKKWLKRNQFLRSKASQYIDFLEQGFLLETDEYMKKALVQMNEACQELKDWVYQNCVALLDANKLVGLIGGDHSCPLAYLEALGERHNNFGVLQIDAHLDLRKAYEGFTYSHASIFYNALAISSMKKLVQVGIRDYCEEELKVVTAQKERIKVFYDHDLKTAQFTGKTFHEICLEIIDQLPPQVYISFDVDGLDPKLCPNTGTPVPGGLDFDQAIYLIHQVVAHGKQIIGFDLCETAGWGNAWDGNVAARLAYKLSNLMGASNQLSTS